MNSRKRDYGALRRIRWWAGPLLLAAIALPCSSSPRRPVAGTGPCWPGWRPAALHLARDIGEGYPGVRVFWPLHDTSWMVSYRWFLGMIVVLTAVRLVLVSAGP